ncbi:MAG TPA: cation diffusion facilitator family transporter [Nitrospirota bacterium]|nr:cation diffusion facilitator family transporter [Nitrospirota bacterium]
MSTSRKNTAIRISIISNTSLASLKLVVGIFMQSVSVISEALHSGIDLLAAVIAYFAVREAAKPPDDKHRFGHGRIENISGTIEAILIFVAGMYIIAAAINKLLSEHIEIEGLGLGAAVMAFSAAVNWFVSSHLLKVARETDSIAIQADGMHLRTDVYTSAGVFVGLMLMKFSKVTILDPLIAIGVAFLIIKMAYNLTKSAFMNILDIKLPNEEEAIIRRILDGYSHNYIEYHKLRTRKAGADRHIDMHLVVSKNMSVELSHQLAHDIGTQIEALLPHSHVLVHVEPCEDMCDKCNKSSCDTL